MRKIQLADRISNGLTRKQLTEEELFVKRRMISIATITVRPQEK